MLLVWLLVGFFTGLLAKALIPKLDRDNWIFAFFIAVTGAMAGGFAAAISGVSENLVINLIIAFIGAVVVLFFYKQYLSDVVGQN